jgi:hypothetical protein
MFAALNTKLLVLLLALVSGIAAYVGWRWHNEAIAQRQSQELRRKATPQEQKQLDDALGWGKSAAAQNKK